jgi:hypothetical protein
LACAQQFTGHPDGLCTASQAGFPDPRGFCIGGCRGCDGQGFCANTFTGVGCQTCQNGVVEQGSCDGAGKCSPGDAGGILGNCYPYACDSTGQNCRSSCNVNADCTPPASCNGANQCK